MIRQGVRDQVGIAMPLTLIVLVILSALMIAFAVLAQSEPVIAMNQYRGAVARALAESGVERAVWALTAGSSVGGGVDPPSSGVVAGPPYDGGTSITIGSGGFTLKITGVSTSEVRIEAVGFTPDNASPSTAYRKITASLMRLPDFGLGAPCALCVRGDLDVTGSATIDARGDTSCGRKYGTYTAGSTTTLGAATTWTGTVTFDAAHPIARDGVVFVDTISGNAPAADNPGDYANASFQSGAFSRGDFQGWIIVMGNVTAFDVTGTLRGLLYVMNALTSSGTSPVHGLVVVQSLAAADRSQTGLPVSFDCAGANGAGTIPTGWFLTGGSYKEVSG